MNQHTTTMQRACRAQGVWRYQTPSRGGQKADICIRIDWVTAFPYSLNHEMVRGKGSANSRPFGGIAGPNQPDMQRHGMFNNYFTPLPLTN